MAAPVDLVSVVIPTRNRRERLREAIASVQAQDWPALEVIVVDDASADGTDAMMSALASTDTRIRYLRNATPLGGSGARNAGIHLATGKYIAFLDDDDIWLPGKLAHQYVLLSSNPATAAVSCSFILSVPGRADVVRQLHAPHNEQELLRANHLGGASVCFARRQRLLDIGGFDPALRSGQDWDLWLKLHASGPIKVCAEPLVRYIMHADERITGNAMAQYTGRRKIHLRYRRRMTPETRLHSLCELIFYRRVQFSASMPDAICGLLGLMRIAPGLNKLRFANRLLRLVRHRRAERAAA